MTFTEAAEAVLKKSGKPLHYKKITQLAIEQNLLSHVGKTPEVTMSTRLATLAKKDRGEAAIVRVKPGIFGLRDWGATASDAADESEGDAPEESGASAAESPAEHAAESVESVPRSPEERERAERIAAASQLFPEEADDDEPVLGDKPVPAAAATAEGGAAGEAGRGRRRRRRRRGGRNERGEAGTGGELSAEDANGDLGPEREPGEDDDVGPMTDEPGALEAAGEAGEGGAQPVVPNSANGGEPGAAPGMAEHGGARPEGRRESLRNDRRDEPRRDDRRDDRERRDEPRRDDRRDDRDRRGMAVMSDDPRAAPDETGRDAADLLVSLLTRRDERQPVPLRALVDDGLRGGRLSGDPSVLGATLAAAARVDTSRREARGERPRLRIQAGRVSLVDWALGPDLVRAEADALVALERLRDAARRQLVRRLNELPQAAFTEMVVLLLERVGISTLRGVRRPGLPQGEMHLAGIARRAGEEIRVAVVIKRGGEIGRERVIEMRGSMHHYGPAAAAWLITTGNVLSGAREEAQQLGTSPVTLVDGANLGRLADEHAVGVRHAAVSVPYVDLDLFDALRGA